MDAWFDPVLSFADSPWAYLIVALFAFADAMLPIVPSETALITCGVFASVGGVAPNLFLLIVAGAAGAWAGDNLVYLLGKRAEPFATRHLLSGDRGRRARKQAERWLDERGGVMIFVGRYIPAGRTAVSLTAGVTDYPGHRFRVFTALAGLAWATYATMLGYWGGTAFKDSPVKAVLAGVITAAVIGLLVEAVRRVLARRRRARGGTASDEA
ncbi:DedA family protein [Yinghuangia seranimata]|uniref:DedA family protein n=1 Tax=Yinghuangia seranimata TaxID=408067 RepID=UPI00248D0AB7|nr:DedA family protein [Yinghuangia seranimata]MDI2129667.1 DedA family protein [Yinghuangia seranimata]